MESTLFSQHDPSEHSSVPKRTALEHDFPGGMLSQVGTKESWRKEVHRPATSTHKWWAKRLGTVFRGIIASAVSETASEAEEVYSRPSTLKGLTLLDPFAGSGTTAVESLKLGARTIAFDINPVATLVQRQAIQPWSWDRLERLYRLVEADCRGEIDRVHRTEDGRTALYYFWVAGARCPTCQSTVHLFDSPVFSRNAYPKRVPRAQLVCPQCLDIQEGRYDFEQATCANGHVMTQAGNVVRTMMTCSNGHSHRVIDALNGSRPTYSLYAKMVVDPQGRKSYEAATEWDRRLYTECETLLAALPANAVLPNGSLEPGNNTAQAIRWNFTRWDHFFNARQLYSLSLLATAIRDLEGASAEREALCALFSGTLEFNNMFTSFKGEGTGAVRHMFSHHILKPERTPLEAHPWGTPQSSGSFSTLLNSRLGRAHQYKQEPVDLVVRTARVERVLGVAQSCEAQVATSWADLEAGKRAYVATCNSAKTDLPDDSVDLVVTDPPYMDNVHYAELADFFHSWLKEMRPYSDYPMKESTRESGEVQDADPAAFGRAIGAVWSECARVLKPEGLLAFTFHQARITGWVELIQALRNAGLTITSIQPVTGEMATSVVKAGAREPSNLDSIVVCRKAAFVGSAVHSTVEDAYNAALARLENLINAQVAVGPGDVRSVMRGTLLAHLGATGDSLFDQLDVVDELADQAIETLSTGVVGLRVTG